MPSWNNENQEFTVVSRPRMTAEQKKEHNDRVKNMERRLQTLRNQKEQSLIRKKKRKTKYAGKKGLTNGPNMNPRSRKRARTSRNRSGSRGRNMNMN